MINVQSNTYLGYFQLNNPNLIQQMIWAKIVEYLVIARINDGVLEHQYQEYDTKNKTNAV